MVCEKESKKMTSSNAFMPFFMQEIEAIDRPFQDSIKRQRRSQPLSASQQVAARRQLSLIEDEVNKGNARLYTTNMYGGGDGDDDKGSGQPSAKKRKMVTLTKMSLLVVCHAVDSLICTNE